MFFGPAIAGVKYKPVKWDSVFHYGNAVPYSTIACTLGMYSSFESNRYTHILPLALNRKYVHFTGIFAVFDTKCVNWGNFFDMKIDNILFFK